MRTEGWARNNRSIHWQLDGDAGPIIVMLHEMGGSIRSFDAVSAALADDRFRIVRIDQRGFGMSEKPRSSYFFGDLADDVAAVLDDVASGERVALLAVASACAIAVDFAIRYPDRARRLLLCSPALELSEPMRVATRDRADKMMSAEMATMADRALSAMYPDAIRDSSFGTHRARFLANDPVGMALATRAFADSCVDVTAVKQPSLLLAGAHDIRTAEQVCAVAARMSDARVEVVERGGHMMAVQAPDAVAQHARVFLGETGGGY